MEAAISLLVFVIIVLVALCLALYACSLIPGDSRIVRLIQLVCVVIAALAILQRAGLV